MNNRHIYFLSLVLTVLCLALFVYKAKVLGFPIAGMAGGTTCCAQHVDANSEQARNAWRTAIAAVRTETAVTNVAPVVTCAPGLLSRPADGLRCSAQANRQVLRLQTGLRFGGGYFSSRSTRNPVAASAAPALARFSVVAH